MSTLSPDFLRLVVKIQAIIIIGAVCMRRISVGGTAKANDCLFAEHREGGGVFDASKL